MVCLFCAEQLALSVFFVRFHDISRKNIRKIRINLTKNRKDDTIKTKFKAEKTNLGFDFFMISTA